MSNPIKAIAALVVASSPQRRGPVQDESFLQHPEDAAAARVIEGRAGACPVCGHPLSAVDAGGCGPAVCPQSPDIPGGGA